MAHHFGLIWGRISGRLRGIDRELNSAHRGNRAYSRGLPAATLFLCFTILVVAGVASGVPAVEFIPIAIFEAMVIAGVFVACMMPAVSPPDDGGDRGPDPDPEPGPGPADPKVWVRMLADIDMSGPEEAKDGARELAGAPR